MANIKGRVNAPKSATRGKGSMKSFTIVKNASDSGKKVTENIPPPRRRGDLTALQEVLMKNEQIDFDKCTDKLIKLNQLPKPPRPRQRKPRIRQPKVDTIPRFVSKSGRLIGPRTRDSLQMIDTILKGELMIEIEVPNKEIEKTVVTAVSNNNEVGISDQNGTYYAGLPVLYIPTPPEEENKTSKANSKKLQQSLNKDTKSGIKTEIKKSLSKKNTSKKNTSQRTTKNSNKSYFEAPETPKPKRKYKKKKKPTDKTIKTKQVTLSNGLVLTLALFQCDHCEKMFSSKASIRRHMYTHLKIQPHRCKNCSKKFRYKMHLHTHMLKHHKDLTHIAPMVCQICDKEFLLQENLELHLSTHIKNENAFKCVYCNKQFSYHLLLTQHEKQHLLTGKYHCSVCQLSFDSVNRLKFHMKSHLKIKDYVCQHCGKEFLRMNSLRRHVQICHSGHRLQCPVCLKKLKGHLTEHMRTHKKARPHECDLCGRRFTQSTQLTVHRRCHTGERPFVCRICDRNFTHSNSLMLHIRRHTGEKPFQCTVCPLSFSQLPHMKTHLYKIHKLDAPYKCPKCKSLFKMKKEMETHLKNCKVGDRELTFEEKIQASVQIEEVEVETPMRLSRMRYLLALLLTMVANKKRLKFLGFNKRPIEELLLESIEAIGKKPCKKKSLTPIKRLKTNIQILLEGTIPDYQMKKFKKEHKTTEEILEILTDERKIV